LPLPIIQFSYYTGQAHAGEFVQLVREPHNPYDRNAVRVDGLRGEKVGHIKKEQAAIIAKLMDNANLRLQLEAVIPRPGTPYTMPVKLEFYAVSPAMAAPQVSQALASQLEGAFRRRHNFQLAQGMKDQTTEADDDSAIATAPPIVQKETLNWQTQAQELDKMFDKQTAQQLQNLPEMEMPSQFHDVTLFEYQELGIRWLIHQEASNRTAPFYKKVVEKGKTVWLCEITRSSQPQAPVPIRGGILADGTYERRILKELSLRHVVCKTVLLTLDSLFSFF
jgi:SWI/SNF-related matrix-associated actin-dependent regulator of chromatin subfamily A3